MVWNLDPDNPYLFCSNCSFNDHSNLSPYQTSDGFATAPESIQMSNCPSRVTLQNQSFTIQLSLKDGFNNTVMGFVITESNLEFALSSPNCGLFNISDQPVPIDPKSGLVTFENVYLRGKNQAICTLVASISNLSIASETCDVTLSGCPKGEQIVQSSSYDYCEQKFFTTVRVLLLIIFFLSLLLALIMLIVFISFLSRKYRGEGNIEDENVYALVEDFLEKPQPSLEEILSDHNITQIPMEEIIVIERIGLGASGVVSKGVWKAKNG